MAVPTCYKFSFCRPAGSTLCTDTVAINLHPVCWNASHGKPMCVFAFEIPPKPKKIELSKQQQQQQQSVGRCAVPIFSFGSWDSPRNYFVSLVESLKTKLVQGTWFLGSPIQSRFWWILEFSIWLVMESGANLKEKFQRRQDQIVSGVLRCFCKDGKLNAKERLFFSSCSDPCRKGRLPPSLACRSAR